MAHKNFHTKPRVCIAQVCEHLSCTILKLLCLLLIQCHIFFTILDLDCRDHFGHFCNGAGRVQCKWNLYLKGMVCTICHFILFKNWLKHIFVLTAYVWETAPCSALPSADENAVTESTVTTDTVSSSLFQSATVLTKNEFLYCSVLLSEFWSHGSCEFRVWRWCCQNHNPWWWSGVFFFYFCLLALGNSLEAWLGFGPSQSCRGLSAVAASFVPAVVAGLAPGAYMCPTHPVSLVQ